MLLGSLAYDLLFTFILFVLDHGANVAIDDDRVGLECNVRMEGEVVGVQ